MRYAALPLAAAMANLAAAGLVQQCTGTAFNEDGNFFCGEVDQIVYQGIGGSGSYEAITGMTDSGECQRETKSFNGPLAPLDEGLSLHFRGPLHLKEFAVYTPATKTKRTATRRRRARGASAAAHGHRQFHDAIKEKRAEWVTATINGKVVSWENNWFGSSPATSTPNPAAAAPTTAPPPPPALPKAKPPPAAASGKDWDRTSYYNAEAQQAENLVFLGNHGGKGSGKFDYWGNSLAFLNTTGTGGTSSSQVLGDVVIPSNQEFAIFSGQPCDGSCGFSRAEDVAYKGFEGAHKVFLFHFKMPLDGSDGFNADMPAIWALNAHIPRTAQYNKCSCWPACGEFDFFEVLRRGDNKCKSTVHLKAGAGAGGSSDYFRRPTDAFVKAAVVFDATSGAVMVRFLPADTDFGRGLDAETVQGWMATGAPAKEGGGLGEKVVSSIFQLAGGLLG